MYEHYAIIVESSFVRKKHTIKKKFVIFQFFKIPHSKFMLGVAECDKDEPVFLNNPTAVLPACIRLYMYYFKRVFFIFRNWILPIWYSISNTSSLSKLLKQLFEQPPFWMVSVGVFLRINYW